MLEINRPSDFCNKRWLLKDPSHIGHNEAKTNKQKQFRQRKINNKNNYPKIKSYATPIIVYLCMAMFLNRVSYKVCFYVA